jgi:hypothetical protein
MELNGRSLYFVAVKLLLRSDDRLLITHDIFGRWDISGGRMQNFEFNKPLPSVADRKMTEKVGSDVKFELGGPKVFFRVERYEHGVDQKVRIFAVGYEAEYISGEIKLGDNHDDFKWVDVNTFKPEDSFEGGWEIGLREYLESLV